VLRHPPGNLLLIVVEVRLVIGHAGVPVFLDVAAVLQVSEELLPVPAVP
jgi:hypothetical protein